MSAANTGGRTCDDTAVTGPQFQPVSSAKLPRYTAAILVAALLASSGCSLGSARSKTKRPLGDLGVSMEASVRPLGERGVVIKVQLTNKTKQKYVVADGVPATASTTNPVGDKTRVYAVKRPDLGRELGGEVVEFALRTFEPWPRKPEPGPLLMRGSVVKGKSTVEIVRSIKDVGVLNSPFRGILGKNYRPDIALVCVGVVPAAAIQPDLQPQDPRPEGAQATAAPQPSTPRTIPDSPVLAHGTQQYVLCSRPKPLRRSPV